MCMTYHYQHGLVQPKSYKLFIAAGSIVSAAILVFAMMVRPAAAAPAQAVVVTPGNTQGWSTADTRPGGAVNFVDDATAPAGSGALQLTTDATTTAKAQYLHEANVPIGQVTDLSYDTKQNSGPVFAAPSYQLVVDTNGAAAGGFTTFVYEPYQNGVVTPGVWQSWDVDQGQFWSSRNLTCTGGSFVAGGGGAPFYTLAQIQATCPEAVAIGFGVNIGSNNPSYDVESDLVAFNGTAYDFETRPYVATNKDECKNDGWKNFQAGYKNQGQCVSSVVSNKNQ